ncbi:MAG: starch-binding protein [Muribaculaceae bacterium]|nr:starch-binding protein [Muribaculaceae bacterium]
MKKLNAIVAACGFAAAALNANAAAFQGVRSDFRDETIYFAMTTRFYDGDPKNNVLCWDLQDLQIANNDPCWRGDFKGLIDKLDYIKALGFTAIWITPVVQNASGYDYHGYHAMDFSKVDLRYESHKSWGSSEDVTLQSLIDAAHKKGLKIVLDVVLQHTGNFGENKLNHLFTRDQRISNQATPAGSLIPDGDKFPANYFELEGKEQYNLRWKYFKNPQYEPNNYYHHYGTGWNWDLPNRWWGQIAGDCVDLNTENDYVANYIVECYGNFIRMGIDGFRVDTSGHIAPLTFNKQFTPKFLAIAEEPEVKKKRLNGCPFFMFGEVCQRFQGSVVYRDQPNLSSYFYTWKSDQALLNEYNGSPEWWRQQNLPEGHDTPVGPMAVCEKDTKDKPTSNNAFLVNGQWHEPDYSQYSGFSVIDFPVHYSFNNVGNVIGLIKDGDKKYNDASYNVVYVDSHDYGPGPNDGTRFNGGTAQWAENLSFMFTMRGIPCIYYGSEVEFQAGKKVDNYGDPMKDGGRAYFGAYLEGKVEASDFGEFTASGNVAKTLDGDLAQHIRRLNQIRAAVPALRKGQYTFDGCSANGGWAFKRAYKNESYALVAVNGGATFTGVPAGTYVDVVTGTEYTPAGGKITVDAPKTKGQLRVLVKDWPKGKIVGEHGKFIYATSPVNHGGNPKFTDPGTTVYYKPDDVVDHAKVTFSPDGGSFKTEKLTVTATLNSEATTGWFKVGNQAQVTLTPGKPSQFTIGDGMSYGQSVTVTWSATGTDGKAYTGSASYKKVDPNAAITVYVTGMNGADIAGTNVHAWTSTGDITKWPGRALTQTQVFEGKTFYYTSFDDCSSVNIIFNRGGSQTADITGIDSDTFFEYDGGSNFKKITVNQGPQAPRVSANPASGTKFNSPIKVTLTASPATTIYYTLNGQPASASSTVYSGPITISNTTTINTYVKNEVGENRQSFVYTYVDTPIVESINVYYEDSDNWGNVNAYCWDDNHQEGSAFSGKWPGKNLAERVQWQGKNLFKYSFVPSEELKNAKIIFNGNGAQTEDFDLINNAIYNRSGKIGEMASAVDNLTSTELKVYGHHGTLVIEAECDCVVAVAALNGTVRMLDVKEGANYFELPKGFYIAAGKKVIL